MSLKLDSRWTAGVQDREALETSLVASAYVLKKLREFILELQEQKTMPRDSDYDSPAWPYLRADKDGYAKGLRDILRLIPEFDQKE